MRYGDFIYIFGGAQIASPGYLVDVQFSANRAFTLTARTRPLENIGKPDRQACSSKPEKVLCNRSFDKMLDRQPKIIEVPVRFKPAFLKGLLPSELVDLAVEVDRAAKSLSGRLPAAAAAELADLVRIMNCSCIATIPT